MPITVEQMAGYGLPRLRQMKNETAGALERSPEDPTLLDKQKKIDLAIDIANPKGRGSRLYEAMGEFLNSEEGLGLLIEATELGVPAIQGVDIRLQEIFGQQYNNEGATLSAGHRISNIMNAMGYTQQPVELLPKDEGFVAINGHVYSPE